MDTSNFAPLAGSTITAALGLTGIVNPAWVAEFTSLDPVGKVGKAEVRATYGGFFLFMGIFAIWIREPDVFHALGWAWVGAAAGRTLSVILEPGIDPRNVAGIAFEGTCGALLLA